MTPLVASTKVVNAFGRLFSPTGNWPALEAANVRIPGLLFVQLLLTTVIAVLPGFAQVVTYPAPGFQGPAPVLPTFFTTTVKTFACTDPTQDGTTTTSYNTSENWLLPTGVQYSLGDNIVALTLHVPPNIYTLNNGVSEGQGYSLTAGPVTENSDTEVQTYSLNVAGATLSERYVDTLTLQSTYDNGTWVRTVTSSYNIMTGVQSLSEDYEVRRSTTYDPTFAGCDSQSTVSETGSATYYFFGKPNGNGLGPAGTSMNPQAAAVEPISTGNGNYYYVHTDLSVSDHIAAIPLAFQRSYNSLAYFPGPLGNMWSHNFNIKIVPTFNLNSTAATVMWGDGHAETFTSNGSSNIYVSALGVTSTLTSDPVTGAYTVTRKDGVQYLFNPYLQLQSIQDTNGRSITASRDASNNLISLTSGQQTLSLSYDSTNHLSEIADQSGRTVSYSYNTKGNLISETDPAGHVTKYAYDSSNRLTSITLPNGHALVRNTYDSSSRVVSQTNANGLTTTLSYNTPAPGQTTITDPLGNSTIHTYDSSIRITGITDALGNTTSYTYDANNNVASITDARGNATSSTYDSLGNLLTYTDQLGNTASFTYNSFSEPLTITPPRGNTTSLAYDANGNLTTLQDPLGDKTTLAYDSGGDLLSVTDARNNTTNLSYLGCAFCVTAITDPLGNQTSFGYDAIGRLTSVTDPDLHKTSIAYDALSHIVSVADPLSNETLFTYDTVSNLTKVTDANKHATLYTYDPVGNLTEVTEPLLHKTSYTYDKNNNRISFTNANGRVTQYGYDPINRLVAITDPLSHSTAYGYDQVSNVISLTDANGNKNSFTYDNDNRLSLASYSDGSVVKYAFDADGNRTSLIDAHGSTTYGYDGLDRVTSTVFPGSVSVQYAYDPVGNRSSLIYPDSSSLSFTYDADNRLSTVTDWLSRNTSYAYDPASNLTGITYPNTVTSALTYDTANRLTGITDSANSVAYRTLAYTLDKVGNRTTMTDGGIATKYTYNALNELLSSAIGSVKTSWTYDAVGNRTKQTAPKAVVTNYTYDAADRMLTAGSTTFTYDNNGNRLTAGATTYAYDALNRLIFSTGSAGMSSFAYDGDGNRVSQTTPAGTYNYINDTAVALPVVLNEQGPDGAIDYAYGLGLGPLESLSSAFNYFYSADALGSVDNLTDTTGAVKETYSYDAWGNALTVAGSVGTQNKFRFTGQALDPTTGLYFLRARYYDQTAGRMVSKDPFKGTPWHSISQDRFVYATNNPLRWIDPSGLQAEESPDEVIDPFAEPASENSPWVEKTPQGEFIDNFLNLIDNTRDFIKQTTDSGSSSCPSSQPPLPPLPPLPPDFFYNPIYSPRVPVGPSIGIGTTGGGAPATCGVPSPPPSGEGTRSTK